MLFVNLRYYVYIYIGSLEGKLYDKVQLDKTVTYNEI